MAHISLVTLAVDDLERATVFYEALGWRRSTASVEGTVTFFHGAPVLALFGRQALAGDAGLPPGVPSPTASALAMNVASESEVDRIIETAAAAGARITKQPERADWGGYSGYFIDEDDHLWEVAYNPGFKLLPDGRVVLPGNDASRR